MTRRTATAITAITAIAMLVPLLGCGANGRDDKTKAAASAGRKEATITVYKSGLNLTDTEFQTFFVEPIKKKFPHLTLKLVADEKGTKPEELLATNSFPDIIFTSNPSYHNFLKLKVVNKLDDLAKQELFELNRVKPVIVESIRSYTGDSELIALPFSLNVAALFYNKDIFDKFAVGYPKETMTWDETLKLARQLTRSDNGVQYVGIDLTGPMNIGRGLSLPLIDPQSGKAAVHTESWNKVFQLLKQSYEIPGYIGEGNVYSYGNKSFLQDRKLAMLPNWLGGLIGPLQELTQQGNDFAWDIAPLPNFAETLGTGREIDIHSMMLSNISPNKEQAFQVMAYMLSDEVQTIVARSGRLSVLNSNELEKQFGAELTSLKGKQLANVFKAGPRKLHSPSEYDKDVAIKRLDEAAKEVAVGGVDVNTALRNAQAAIDLEIQALKAAEAAKK